MTALNMISAKNLWNCVGAPDCPVLINARTDGDFAADPRLIPLGDPLLSGNFGKLADIVMMNRWQTQA